MGRYLRGQVGGWVSGWMGGWVGGLPAGSHYGWEEPVLFLPLPSPTVLEGEEARVGGWVGGWLGGFRPRWVGGWVRRKRRTRRFE